ncbi:hypothetical protein EV424DRAFT_1444797, partial [Suillus variegatus]
MTFNIQYSTFNVQRSTFNNFLSALVHSYCVPGAGMFFLFLTLTIYRILQGSAGHLYFLFGLLTCRHSVIYYLSTRRRSKEALHEMKSSRKLCESITISSNVSDLIPRPIMPTSVFSMVLSNSTLPQKGTRDHERDVVGVNTPRRFRKRFASEEG